MCTARQSWWAVFLTAMLVLTGITVYATDDQKSVLTVIDSKAIGRLLYKAGLPKKHVVNISRNTHGTKVYVEISNETNNANTVLIVNAGKVDKIQALGHSLVFDDADKLVCWMTNRTLVFSNGHQVQTSIFQRFNFSPGGRFFFFYDPTNGASVFQTIKPDEPLLRLPSGFLPQRLFYQTNSLFVFGRKFSSNSELAWGLIYSETNSFSEAPREIDISQSGGIIDMSADADTLLIQSKRDLWPSWFLYNTKTETRTRIGWAKQYGFFLDGEVHKWIGGNGSVRRNDTK